jgi:small-conductance mechanosensitive channel
VVYLIIRIFGISVNVSAAIGIGFGYSLILTIILAFISFIDRVELILLGLIPVIITGFIINRFGVSEGEFIIPFAFLLSAIGFIILVFRSRHLLRTSKTKGLIFVLLYSVIAILNSLLLIKFLGTRPALNNVYDTIGVVIFLLACLALFIILPFSNFTEWPANQKLSFKRLIITPLIVFLLIFSLKFLLPDKIYRSIFFKEYSQNETIHFQMVDYKVDFSGK